MNTKSKYPTKHIHQIFPFILPINACQHKLQNNISISSFIFHINGGVALLFLLPLPAVSCSPPRARVGSGRARGGNDSENNCAANTSNARAQLVSNSHGPDPDSVLSVGRLLGLLPPSSHYSRRRRLRGRLLLRASARYQDWSVRVGVGVHSDEYCEHLFSSVFRRGVGSF